MLAFCRSIACVGRSCLHPWGETDGSDANQAIGRPPFRSLPKCSRSLRSGTLYFVKGPHKYHRRNIGAHEHPRQTRGFVEAPSTSREPLAHCNFVLRKKSHARSGFREKIGAKWRGNLFLGAGHQPIIRLGRQVR